VLLRIGEISAQQRGDCRTEFGVEARAAAPAQQRQRPHRGAIVLWARPAGYVERAVRVDPRFRGHRLAVHAGQIGISPQEFLEIRRHPAAPAGAGQFASVHIPQRQAEVHELR
jgi:hypothetical protein